MKKKNFVLIAVTLLIFGLFLWSTSFTWVNYSSESVPPLVRGKGENGLYLSWLFFLVSLVVMANVFKWPTFARAYEYNLFSRVVALFLPLLTLASINQHIVFLQDKGWMDIRTILQDVITPAFGISVVLSLLSSFFFELLLIRNVKRKKTEDYI